MALSLDDGAFRAVPAPHNARPRVSASPAFFNLLAGATANNFSVIEAATEHGMSFGLAWSPSLTPSSRPGRATTSAVVNSRPAAGSATMPASPGSP